MDDRDSSSAAARSVLFAPYIYIYCSCRYQLLLDAYHDSIAGKLRRWFGYKRRSQMKFFVVTFVDFRNWLQRLPSCSRGLKHCNVTCKLLLRFRHFSVKSLVIKPHYGFRINHLVIVVCKSAKSGDFATVAVQRNHRCNAVNVSINPFVTTLDCAQVVTHWISCKPSLRSPHRNDLKVLKSVPKMAYHALEISEFSSTFCRNTE